MQLGRYISAIKRYRWLILAVVVAGTGIGLLATRFIDPVYTVNSTIYIRAPEGGDGRNIGESKGLIEGQNWVQLLTTAQVLDSVIVQERLFLQPESVADSLLFKGFDARWPWRPGSYILEIDEAGRRFALRTSEGRTVDQGTVGDSIGVKLGMFWQPSAALLGRDREIRFDLRSPREAGLALQKDIVTNMMQEGNFLSVSLTGPDPARLTRTLNSIGERFVNYAGELKRRRTTA
ncbi:MAG TPA: Wzz/FepE/Etk N-terminal domain-containing protein, partial [Gemmatimonadales bacterium]|nr:Wzz/FepE/Etk N-terminal domain-containing protein [Gemmatimonadales bacterium]